jgi:hypothetical protein
MAHSFICQAGGCGYQNFLVHLIFSTIAVVNVQVASVSRGIEAWGGAVVAVLAWRFRSRACSHSIARGC